MRHFIIYKSYDNLSHEHAKGIPKQVLAISFEL